MITVNWDAEMKLMERQQHGDGLRPDDHLTDYEVGVRLAVLDAMAPIRRERPWQSVLGVIGTYIAVLGIAAVLFGIFV